VLVSLAALVMGMPERRRGSYARYGIELLHLGSNYRRRACWATGSIPKFRRPGLLGFAFGTLLGGSLQFVVQLHGRLRRRLCVSPRFPVAHKGVRGDPEA